MNKITVIIPLGKGRKMDFLNGFNKIKNVEIIVVKGPNPSLNRNKGVKKSKTDIVAFINSHTILSSDWVKQVKNFFLKYPNVDMVGGPQLNYKKDNFFAKSSGYALSSLFGGFKMSTRYKSTDLSLDANETMISSANLICKRHVFDKIKFDENFYPGEDPKFIDDAKEAGFVVAYSPDIIVYNRRRNNIFSLSKQIYKYGYFRPYKESLINLVKKPFFFIPSFFLIYLFVTILDIIFQGFNFLLFLPLFLYVFLNLYFSFVNALMRKNYMAFFILPFIYLSIHLSYGLGFIVSIIKKAYKREIF